MTIFQVIARTKAAIRKWADLQPPNDGVLLDDPLNIFRPPTQRWRLRQYMNQEFSGEQGFPVPQADWSAVQNSWSTVRNVRDFAKSRLSQ